MKAFPTAGMKTNGEWVMGMDLRDYFAAKIVIALIPNNTDPQMIPYVCEASYKWADEMMEARK